MPGRLLGKVAIVTGGGRGIGAGIARRFAAEGARVVIATRSEAPGLKTLEAIRAVGGEAVLDVVDVSERSMVSALVRRTGERFGGIDIVLHNAAITAGASLADTPDDVLDDAFDLNIKCCFWLTRDALPWLKRSKAGRILVTSSGNGNRVAIPGRAPYAVTKVAVTGFVRSAAIELAPDRITVNAVEPGFVPNRMIESRMPQEMFASLVAAVPLGRAGIPEDVAALFAFLASDEAGYVTGQSIAVDGGLSLSSRAGSILSPSRP